MIAVGRIIILFWFLLSLLTCFESGKLEFGNFSQPGPGLFPMLLGFLLGFLALLLYFKNRLEEMGQKRERVNFAFKGWNRVLWAVGALLFFGLFLDLLGFGLVAFLTITFLYRKMANLGWRFSISASLFTVTFCYLVFQLWLSVNFPKGILGF